VGSNGSLAPVSGSPFVVSNNSIGPIEITPDGKFLLVSMFSSRVGAFSIDSNGALTPVAGSPFLSGTDGDIISVETNCDGTLLFAADETGEVAVFSVASTGVLTSVPGSPFTLSDGPQRLVTSPNNLL